MKTSQANFVASASLAVLALVSTPALADTATYQLTSPNSAIASFPGPYASVLVNLTAPNTATITFTSLTNSGNIYLMGDGGTVAVNVNAASWTLGTITGGNAGTGFSGGQYSDGGGGQEDGFGVMNQTINSFDGFTHSSDTVSFTLTDTSGTWASAANVLTANSNGALVAAHIFVTSSPANAANGALATGFAANGGARNVIEPNSASLALLALGLLGAGFWTRRKA